MSDVHYVFVLGYVCVTGNLDDEGMHAYGGVYESRALAEEQKADALANGFDEAEVYMLIPPNSISMSGSR